MLFSTSMGCVGVHIVKHNCSSQKVSKLDLCAQLSLFTFPWRCFMICRTSRKSNMYADNKEASLEPVCDDAERLWDELMLGMWTELGSLCLSELMLCLINLRGASRSGYSFRRALNGIWTAAHLHDGQTRCVHVAKAALGVIQTYYKDDKTQFLLH